jgi:hypothetical protein
LSLRELTRKDIGEGKNRNRDRNINNSVIGEIAPAIVGV